MIVTYGLLLQNARGGFFMNRTLKISCTAMFTAVSVAINYFTAKLAPNMALSFTIAVCFLAGIYLGVWPAMIVGFMGDTIAHLIHPLGAYNWFLAISTALFGAICALVYKLPLKSKLLKLVIALLICFVVCICGINTFGLWLQYKVGVEPGFVGLIQFLTTDIPVDTSFWVYLTTRLPSSIPNTIINGIVVAIVQQLRVFDKLFWHLDGEKER